MMPIDVPLNEDGFEDPAAFMNSPAGTDNLTNSTSRRTTLGAPSSVGTSRRQTLGRMSQLDDGSDEDEFNIGPDAALEDDEFDGEPTTRKRVLILAANSTFFGSSSKLHQNSSAGPRLTLRPEKSSPSAKIRIGTRNPWYQCR